MSRRSDFQVVSDAYAQPGTGPHAEHYERFTRPHALAEIQRRGLDVEAVRQRAVSIVNELRKLPHDDLDFMSITDDPDGLWLLAGALIDGRDPLLNFPASGIRPAAGAGRSVKRGPGPARGECAEPRSK